MDQIDAAELRNAPDYDDWEYATEPIPGDKTWCGKCNICTCTAEKETAQ